MIPTGRLSAHGTLFLRSAAYTRGASDAGDYMLQLPLLEKWSTGSQRITAYWAGPAAESFHRAHWQDLRPGKALSITLTNLRVQTYINGTAELTGDVYACSLAPDRWPTIRAAQPDTEPATEPSNPTPTTPPQAA